MVVISDTTAITNLIQIGLLDVIQKLYQNIIIPKAVYDELASFSNQKYLLEKISWITVSEVQNKEMAKELMLSLDIGEAESIVLAIENKSDFLIIDELKGRAVAKSFGIQVIGTLGILVLAKERKIIRRVKPFMDQLKDKVGFRISEKVYQRVLELAQE